MGARGTGKTAVLSMLADEEQSHLADIAERMDVSSGYASEYRRRLVEQGVIEDVCPASASGMDDRSTCVFFSCGNPSRG